jgi:hypothetical protein
MLEEPEELAVAIAANGGVGQVVSVPTGALSVANIAQETAAVVAGITVPALVTVEYPGFATNTCAGSFADDTLVTVSPSICKYCPVSPGLVTMVGVAVTAELEFELLLFVVVLLVVVVAVLLTDGTFSIVVVVATEGVVETVEDVVKFVVLVFVDELGVVDVPVYGKSCALAESVLPAAKTPAAAMATDDFFVMCLFIFIRTFFVHDGMPLYYGMQKKIITSAFIRTS